MRRALVAVALLAATSMLAQPFTAPLTRGRADLLYVKLAGSDTVLGTVTFTNIVISGTCTGCGISGVAWGAITGTLSNQTDLQNALNLKAPLISPSFTTPTLGVALATTVNKLTITTPATSATLTITDGKTAAFLNTLTLAGTDGTTMTFPATSATVARTDAAQTFTDASNATSWNLATPVVAGGLTASGSGSNNFSGSTGAFQTSSGANTMNGPITVADATTPSVTTAAGKTNTGFVQVNGKISGALKLTAADATAQTVTVTTAAQTVGAATATIPDLASVSDTFAFLTKAQTLTAKTILFADGTLSAPSGAFANATGLGFYNRVNLIWALAAVGHEAMNVTDSGTRFTSVGSDGGYCAGNTAALESSGCDVFWSRKAAATWQLGINDLAAPTAQAITVQSVVAGTSNTAGVDLTITASRGTGTGAPGKIVFKAAGAGTTGTTQNAANTIVTIQDKGTAGSSAPDVTFAGTITPSQAAGIVGTTTNNNANAGSFGEYQTGTVAANTTSMTSPNAINVGANTNITLTAGDWDCSGVINFTTASTTSITNLSGGISTTTGTLPAQDSYFDYTVAANVPTAAFVSTWVVPTVRLSNSGSTNVFLVAKATFSASTLTTGGTIRCRRMR